MSKKLMELVTKALKKGGVELKDEAKSALEDALGSDSLKEAGLTELGSGQRVVEESEYNEVHADVRKLRQRAQSAEQERDRLKTNLDTGDSENKKLADRYKTRVDELEPLAAKFTKWARVEWESRAKLLPAEKADAKDDEKARVAKIRGRFVFPEKDKALTESQVLENLDKFAELAELGVFEMPKVNGGGNGGGPGPAPRGNPGAGNEQPVDPDKAATEWYAKTDPRTPQQNAR
jgi:hypothetical protein